MCIKRDDVRLTSDVFPPQGRPLSFKTFLIWVLISIYQGKGQSMQTYRVIHWCSRRKDAPNNLTKKQLSTQTQINILSLLLYVVSRHYLEHLNVLTKVFLDVQGIKSEAKWPNQMPAKIKGALWYLLFTLWGVTDTWLVVVSLTWERDQWHHKELVSIFWKASQRSKGWTSLSWRVHWQTLVK